MTESLAKFVRHSRLELFFFFIGIALIAVTSKPVERKEPRRFIPPPSIIQQFNFGYRETMADVFWIRVVQDFAICENAADADVGQNAGAICNKGWVFHMLDLVTDLAPNFRMPYYYGATNLSVLVNDAQGAKVIFDKGLKQMPNSWDIAYRAAYHYMLELNDKETAAALLLRAGKNGGPSWVYSLAAKLYTDEGKALLAIDVIDSLLRADPDGENAPKLKKRLAEANAALEKAQQSGK